MTYDRRSRITSRALGTRACFLQLKEPITGQNFSFLKCDVIRTSGCSRTPPRPRRVRESVSEDVDPEVNRELGFLDRTCFGEHPCCCMVTPEKLDPSASATNGKVSPKAAPPLFAAVLSKAAVRVSRNALLLCSTAVGDSGLDLVEFDASLRSFVIR